MFGVSIIICCYNSQQRLPDTIKILSQIYQDKSIPWEVILVDNISTDKTAEVAQSEWDKYEMHGVNFSIVTENKAGLNFARRKGAMLAKFKWLLYCDDDNWLGADYFINFKNIIDNNQALKMVCCGISKAIYEKAPNKWFYKYQHLCVVFNITDYGYDSRISKNISDGCDVCGAGMFVQKDYILEYFTDDGYMISDRTGKKLNSGGDTDLVNYFLKKNYEIGQYANLQICHFIPKERTTRAYILRLTEGMSYSTVLLSYKENFSIEKPFFFKMLKSSVWQIFQLKIFIAFLTVAHYLGKKRAYNEISIIL